MQKFKILYVEYFFLDSKYVDLSTFATELSHLVL